MSERWSAIEKNCRSDRFGSSDRTECVSYARIDQGLSRDQLTQFRGTRPQGEGLLPPPEIGSWLRGCSDRWNFSSGEGMRTVNIRRFGSPSGSLRTGFDPKSYADLSETVMVLQWKCYLDSL